MIRIKGLLPALVVCALPLGAAIAGDLPGPDASGWYRWTVGSPAPVSTACCYEMTGAAISRRICNLDNGRGAHTQIGDCRTGAGELRLYVHMHGGRPARIRALSSACTVSADTDIVDAGILSRDLSIGWLRNVVFSDDGRSVKEEAVAALGLIADDGSVAALIGIVEAKPLAMNLRENALFWLAQSESNTAFAFLDRLLTQR